MSIEHSNGNDEIRIAEPRLSASDLQNIAEFGRQLQLLDDRTNSVIYCHATAVCVIGRPGTGKTHQITKHLAACNVPWFLHNARLTAMGLYDLLSEHRDKIAVLDDVPSLFRDKQALQILMAALDGPANRPRTVRYKSRDRDDYFEYNGRLILIGNVGLSHDPFAQAVGSRVQFLEHDPSDEVLGAYIKKLALSGHMGLSPAECWEVAEFVIEETRATKLRLDLRTYFKGLEDYRQSKLGHAKTPWQWLIRSSLRKSIVEFCRPKTKAEEIVHQRELLLSISREFPHDCKRWLDEFISRTQLGRTVFYDRKHELQDMGLLPRKCA